jgi:hypothetical protein
MGRLDVGRLDEVDPSLDEAYVRERCDLKDFEIWARFIADERHAPEAVQERGRRWSPASPAGDGSP